MTLSKLTAVSPIDGRYGDKTESLAQYHSEFALIRKRLEVEVLYFCKLVNTIPELIPIRKYEFLSAGIHDLYRNFTLEDAQAIKAIEKITNHDVKAVEYFLKEKLAEAGLEEYIEFVHFGLTSEDVDSPSRTSNLALSVKKEIIPLLESFLVQMTDLAKSWLHVPVLARTHGQPASPTIVGKELAVIIARIKSELSVLKNVRLSAKFGGATGNFNALYLSHPTMDWDLFAQEFLQQFNFYRDYPTTQIQHFDSFAEMFDSLKRICGILSDCSIDFWLYISRDYFKQKIKKGEVGSSAMPHKVNPLDFENAEGNLDLAISLFESIARKIQRSREQRDLSLSTVLRNVGVPLGYMMIAIKSLAKGFGKLILNEEKINSELDANWAVVSEALQTILRQCKYPQPYETLKDLTRNNEKITQESIHQFIDRLHIDDDIKEKMKTITPYNYTGIPYVFPKDKD